MSDIDAIKGLELPNEGAGLFLKLADGETVKARITSLPVIFTNIFVRNTGEEDKSTRLAFIIWNHDLKKPQIWETNAATYGQQIAPLLEDEDYGDWREYDVKISRSGEKQATRYNVRPGTKRYKLDKVQTKACEDVNIIATLQKGQGKHNVLWLAEYRNLKEQGLLDDNGNRVGQGDDNQDPEAPPY